MEYENTILSKVRWGFDERSCGYSYLGGVEEGKAEDLLTSQTMIQFTRLGEENAQAFARQ
jgi:hypothetical protein